MSEEEIDADLYETVWGEKPPHASPADAGAPSPAKSEGSDRSARLEGAISVLLGALDAWKSDSREVAARTERRVLAGLEAIEALVQDRHRKSDENLRRVEQAIARLDQTQHTVLARLEALEDQLRRREELDEPMRYSDSPAAVRD